LQQSLDNGGTTVPTSAALNHIGQNGVNGDATSQQRTSTDYLQIHSTNKKKQRPMAGASRLLAVALAGKRA
jgi:hypothetical protein